MIIRQQIKLETPSNRVQEKDILKLKKQIYKRRES
jgi:hypothetical protein